VGAVGGAEGVVHEDVGELGQTGAELGDLGGIGLGGGAVLVLDLALFLDVEAEVFEEEHFTGLERGGGGFGDRADAIGGEGDGLAEDLFEFGGDGLEGEFLDHLAIRTAEVAGEDDRRAFFKGVLDRGQRGDDARVVGDGTGLLVLGDVEIDADEHAFAGEVEVADGFEFRHDRKGSSGIAE